MFNRDIPDIAGFGVGYITLEFGSKCGIQIDVC
jgi:hypothetical protein